jgi:hypothetical protein
MKVSRGYETKGNLPIETERKRMLAGDASLSMEGRFFPKPARVCKRNEKI